MGEGVKVMPLRILIVEDNTDFRKVVKQYLKQQNNVGDIYEATTGEMAVMKASFVKPDVILMDIHLPKANGIEVAQHIKEDNPQCDIIVLTMFETEDSKKFFQREYVTDFIGKSELYDRLVPSLKKCLQRKQAREKTGNKDFKAGDDL
jgi:DNA-binding NarL/FixJ family response regulator